MPKAAPQMLPAAPLTPAASGYAEGQPRAQEGAEEGSEFWTLIKEFRLKITDTIIAAFTALLFFATVALWWATRRLVRGADRTSERQLRAYVGKENVSFINLGSGRDVSVRVCYKNYGSTPAVNFDIRLKIGWIPYPIDHELKGVYDDTVRPDTSLMPNAMGIAVCEVQVDGFQDVREAVRTSRIAIILIGTIVYQDVFNRPHSSRVTMIATGDRAMGDSPFIYMPYGNADL